MGKRKRVKKKDLLQIGLLYIKCRDLESKFVNGVGSDFDLCLYDSLRLELNQAYLNLKK